MVKTIALFLIASFLFLFHSQAQYGSYTTLDRDTTIEGILFPKGSEVTSEGDGKLHEVTLHQDLELNGMPFKGRVAFSDGKVTYGTLAQDTKISDMLFPRGTDVFFEPYGAYYLFQVKLKEDVTLRGAQFIPGMVCFYKNGSFWYFRNLAAPHEFNGILFDTPSCNFYESGMIEIGTLAQDTTFGKVVLAKGTEITFFQSGKPNHAKLVADTQCDNIRFAKGSDLWFHESGVVNQGTLAQDVQTGADTFPSGSVVTFDTAGKLERIKLSQDSRIDGVAYSKGSEVSLVSAQPTAESSPADNSTAAVPEKSAISLQGGTMHADGQLILFFDNSATYADVDAVLKKYGLVGIRHIGIECVEGGINAHLNNIKESGLFTGIEEPRNGDKIIFVNTSVPPEKVRDFLNANSGLQLLRGDEGDGMILALCPHGKEIAIADAIAKDKPAHLAQCSPNVINGMD